MALREQTNTANPLLQSNAKPNINAGENKSSVSRLSRKEMLDKWLEEKKKGADAKKVTQEPVRFEDMLRNDKVNFYNAKSTPGAGTLQSGGLDTAKKSINKENSGIQGSSTPIRTHSANARPSPFGSALNAQKTRSIYGETSNMKTPKSKDQSVGARVNTNYGSRSPLSQLKSNLASRSPFSKDLSQKNLPGDTRHSNPLGPVSTNNFSGARMQSTSAHKTFSGPVMSRLEQARQARKGSPITQASNLKLGGTNSKTVATQEQKITVEPKQAEGQKPENSIEEEVQGKANTVENTENAQNTTQDFFEASDNVREFSGNIENSNNLSEFEFDKTPVKQTGMQNQHATLDSSIDHFSELYQIYKCGSNEWKHQFEKFILNKEGKLTHFCILEGKFKPSDEVGEQYNKDSKFWVLFLQYIRDRAVSEQEYRLYEIVLSQTNPVDVLQRDFERMVDADTSRQIEENNFNLTTPVRSQGPSHYDHISVSPLDTHNYFQAQCPVNNNIDNTTRLELKITGVREQPRCNLEEERAAGTKRTRTEMESQMMEEEGGAEGTTMHQTKKSKESQRNGHRNESRTHLLDFLDHDIDLDQFGSTVSYAVLNATKTQQKKYGTEKILTPVRLSRRLRAKTQNGNAVEVIDDISDFSELPQLQEKNCVFVKNPSLADSWTQDRKAKGKPNQNQ